MTAAAWQTWLRSLPVSPLELQQVTAGLQREVKQAERRLAEVLATGGSSRTHRQASIELNELNSKLLLLQDRLKVA